MSDVYKYLPTHWQCTTIGEITEFVTSGSRGWARYYASSGSLFLRVGDLNRDTINIDLKNAAHVQPPMGAEGKRTSISPGDILISITADVGMIGLAYEKLGEAYVNQHIALLRPVPGVWAKGLAYIFLDPQGLQYLVRKLQYGATKTGLSLAQVRSFKVGLPPLPEQHRIVEAIESYLSRLDEAEVCLERARRNLKRYRASVLKAAVEGRLVATEAQLAREENRDYEPASQLLKRILKERKQRFIEDAAQKALAKAQTRAQAAARPFSPEQAQKTLEAERAKAAKKYKDPPPPDTSQLPELPEGWCWTTIGQSFDVKIGATPKRSVPEYWDGEIPWLSSGEVAFCRINNARETITTEGLNNTSTQINPVGTVLVGMIGEGKTRGQVAILDIQACNNQNAAAIWVSKTPVLPEYVYYTLTHQYEKTRRQGKGGNQPALNKTRVEAIQLPLPPVSEQKRIVSEIEKRISIVDSITSSLIKNGSLARRLRQSILKWAFEGKLADQDPNDEPASVLLERIKTEKAAQEASTKTRGRGRKRSRV